MKINTKEDILIPAWKMIENDSKVKKMYFLPWLLSIIFLTALLVYQSIYTYVVIFHQKEKALEVILQFLHSNYIAETLIFAAIFIILYLLFIPIFEWALIRYIAKKDCESKASAWECLWVWLYKFLPLFKYWNLFSEFKFIAIINGYLFMIRFFEWKYIKELSYVFIFIFLFSIIINLAIAYAKFIIVLENKKIYEAISKSTKLTILNLRTTFKLYLFMFLLNIRVIINFIVFLSFPVLIVLTIWFITTQIFLTIALVWLGLIFLAFILFLWYLTWVLEVFKNSIWYFAYKKSNERYKSIEDEKNE
jgi:hypothetical protein